MRNAGNLQIPNTKPDDAGGSRGAPRFQAQARGLFSSGSPQGIPPSVQSRQPGPSPGAGRVEPAAAAGGGASGGDVAGDAADGRRAGAWGRGGERAIRPSRRGGWISPMSLPRGRVINWTTSRSRRNRGCVVHRSAESVPATTC